MRGVIRVFGERSVVRSAESRSCQHGGLNQRACLELRDAAHIVRLVLRLRGVDVEHLAAADAGGADSLREDVHRAQDVRGRYALQLRHRKFERLHEKSVAREQRERFAELRVVRRFAAAHVVVVHARQVVVYKRRRVQHFKSERHRHRLFLVHAGALRRGEA